jgi:hypothetical protein
MCLGLKAVLMKGRLFLDFAWRRVLASLYYQLTRLHTGAFYRLIDCSRSYADQILASYNDVIKTTTAMYETHERTRPYMSAWFDGKEQNRYPNIGLVDRSGSSPCFGTYVSFRSSSGYLYTIEHSSMFARTSWQRPWVRSFSQP